MTSIVAPGSPVVLATANLLLIMILFLLLSLSDVLTTVISASAIKLHKALVSVVPRLSVVFVTRKACVSVMPSLQLIPVFIAVSKSPNVTGSEVWPFQRVQKRSYFVINARFRIFYSDYPRPPPNQGINCLSVHPTTSSFEIS